ncbi:MAG TPA: kelch repeat-containing protein [Myxococcota bacterium]|nr:kelch repeat-containing protein [Myxococcota bacterium]
MNGRPHLAAYTILGMMFLMGCGPQDGGQIDLKIHYTQPADTPAGLRGEQAPSKGEPPPYITDFRLCVSAADMKLAKCQNFNLDDYLTRGKARIGGIPAGDGRKVTFQGYDLNEPSEQKVYWCGEVSSVAIKKNSTTKINMFISACSNFTLTRGTLATARVFHTATALPDGRVLIAGGFSTKVTDQICTDGDCLRLAASDSIEIYDPTNGTFESGQELELVLGTPRAMHTATLLPDGRVLVTGGCEQAIWYETFVNGPRTLIEVANQGWGTAGSTAEIVDPSSGTVQPITAAMPTSRALHSAMALPNGDVLLFGGLSIGNLVTDAATRYQALTFEFEDLPAGLQVPRQSMLFLKLAGGGTTRALIWGGNSPPQPGAGTFSEIISVSEDGSLQSSLPQFVTSQASMGLPSFYSAGTLLDSGQVLLTGGMLVDLSVYPDLQKPEVLRRYRLVDLTDGMESIAAPANDNSTMNFFRALHTITPLSKKLSLNDDGTRVLIAGGLTAAGSSSVDFEPQNNAEFFTPWLLDTGKPFETIQIKGVSVNMNEARAGHTATTMQDGTILLTGGFTKVLNKDEPDISNTAEIFNPQNRELRVE